MKWWKMRRKRMMKKTNWGRWRMKEREKKERETKMMTMKAEAAGAWWWHRDPGRTEYRKKLD